MRDLLKFIKTYLNYKSVRSGSAKSGTATNEFIKYVNEMSVEMFWKPKCVCVGALLTHSVFALHLELGNRSKIKTNEPDDLSPLVTNRFLYFFLLSGQNNATNITIMGSNTRPCPLRAPLVVTIVGLPCRGKSMAAMRIARHLSWKGEYAKGK